jgi:hypothetical protein
MSRYHEIGLPKRLAVTHSVGHAFQAIPLSSCWKLHSRSEDPISYQSHDPVFFLRYPTHDSRFIQRLPLAANQYKRVEEVVERKDVP